MLALRLSRSVALVVVVLSLAISATASSAGWQEIHQTSDDVRLDVVDTGLATIEHRLRYRIVAGRYKTIDLAGIDPHVDFVGEAVLTADKGGSEMVARVEPSAKGDSLRLAIDDAKGLGRGTYAVTVKYRVDLVSTKMLSRDGAMWKLAWTAPAAIEGQDGARVVFGLPSAPTEPRLAGNAEAATTLTTVRRSTERDEIELVRAHVPRGEAATWAVRIDPKAFPRITAPELRPPPAREAPAPSLLASTWAHVLVPLGMAVLAGMLAMLLRSKQNAVRRAAAMRHAVARPLIALPVAAAPFVYGVVATSALALLLWSSPLAGAFFTAVAMAIGAHRAPAATKRPRGPGAWRPLADARALFSSKRTALPTDALDAGAVRGKLTLLALALAIGGASWLLREHVPQIAVALPLASMALVPLFVTGTRAQMSATPAELARKILRPTRDVLARTVDLSHVEIEAIARVVDTSGAFDEVRLVCAPRDRTPGLRAIELAVAVAPSSHAAFPEILVRFDDGSPAAERIRELAAEKSVVLGRTPDERVLRLAPAEPTPRSAARLLERVIAGLEGRRSTDRTAAPAPKPRVTAWKGRERRSRSLPASPPVPAL